MAVGDCQPWLLPKSKETRLENEDEYLTTYVLESEESPEQEELYNMDKRAKIPLSKWRKGKLSKQYALRF